MMHDRIIVRAPDKMIDITDGFIVLAFRHSLVYFQVNDYGVEDLDKTKKYTSSDNQYFIDVQINEEDICTL